MTTPETETTEIETMMREHRIVLGALHHHKLEKGKSLLLDKPSGREICRRFLQNLPCHTPEGGGRTPRRRATLSVSTSIRIRNRPANGGSYTGRVREITGRSAGTRTRVYERVEGLRLRFTRALCLGSGC